MTLLRMHGENRWAYLEDESIIYKGKALYVHRTLEEGARGFNITHGPSGLAAVKGFYSQEIAVKWCLIMDHRYDWAEGWSPDIERSSGIADEAWWKPRRELANEAKLHVDEGEPERGRDEAYDTLDSDLGDPVIGMGDHGQIWVADVNYQGIVTGYNAYYYMPAEDTCDGQAYWSAGGDWYRELELDGWVFPSGFEVGELDEYHDVAPSGISVEQAEEWSGAYISETLHYCEECSKYFDSESNYRSRYVEEWGDCFCDSCSEDLVYRGKICATHSAPDCEHCDCYTCSECAETRDECECEAGFDGENSESSPEEYSEGNELREGYIRGERTVSMDQPIEDFKREVEAACWDSFDHAQKRAILDGRIDAMLAEVAA